MRRRHPHVFGTDKLSTSRQVLENWEEIKRRERRGSGKSLLDGVPPTLPALLRAHRVQAKAARVGFSWARLDQAWGKVSEELAELENALASRRSARIVEELGDVFFSLVTLARFAKANPEDALHQSIGKFIRRFTRVEGISKRQRRPLSAFSLEELQALWQESKTSGKIRKPHPPAAVRPGRGKFPHRRKTRGARKNPGRPEPGPRARPR
jgi:MazG family protein